MSASSAAPVVEDQKKVLIAECTRTHCDLQWKEYLRCAVRVKGDKTGTKNCIPQYYDYFKCTDHCLAPRLLSTLKGAYRK